MLPKNSHLNLKIDFKRLISGKFIDSKYAKLYIKMGDEEKVRVGIATSSKIFRKAVERNRARRLVSAALEKLYKKLPLKLNILALPKVSILGVKSRDILVNLEEVFKYEKIIN